MKRNRRAEVEVYGFAAYLASFVLFGGYLVWAYAPDEVLHSLGIAYYPDKQWAVIIPFFLMFTFSLVPLVYTLYNITQTEPAHSPLVLTHSNNESKNNYANHKAALQRGGLPPIYDIPLAEVNDRMFNSTHDT
jgi:hypothetical protein